EAAEIFRSSLVRQYFSRMSIGLRVAAHLAPGPARAWLRREIRRWQHNWFTPRLLQPQRRVRECSLRQDRLTPFERYWVDLLARRSLPGLLHFEDRSSMAFSVEARVPFLGRGP